MITMRMKDGAAFMPEDVKIMFTVGEGENAKTYGWEDLAEVMLIDGEYGVSDGRFGPRGMPIRGITWIDTSDLIVRMPVPLEEARQMGAKLSSTKIEIAQSVPTGLAVAQQKPIVLP